MSNRRRHRSAYPKYPTHLPYLLRPTYPSHLPYPANLPYLMHPSHPSHLGT